MYPTPEFIAVIREERERRTHADRLATIALCARACRAASTTLFERLSRVVRGAPTSC